MKNRALFFCGVVFQLLGCHSPVAYRFQLVADRPGAVPSPGVVEDDDVRLAIELDPTRRRAISVRVTNKTQQQLQVQWRHLTLRDPTGAITSPRPEVDVGWVLPQATQTVVITPFALPASSLNGRSYEGQAFELRVPMLIRGEPRSYAPVFVTQVIEVTEKE